MRADLLLRLAAGATVLLLFSPLLYLAALSLVSDGEVRLDAYAQAFSVSRFPLLGRSVMMAVGACAIGLLLGGGAAAVFETRRFPFASVLRTLALASLVIAPVFQVAVWEELARIGGAIAASSSPDVGDAKPLPIRNIFFAAWLLGLSYSPVFFFFISQGVRSLPSECLEAARLFRAPWSVKRHVIAPLCAPWVMAALGLAFPLIFLNYEVPRLLDVTTYPVLIYVEYGARNDPGAAFAAAVPAMLLTLAFALPLFAWADRRGFALSGRSRGTRHLDERVRRPGGLACFFFGSWWVLVAALPLGVLLRLAARPTSFVSAFETDCEKVGWSFLVTLVTSVVAVALAVLLLLPRRRAPRRRSLALWMLLALPGALLALALIRFSRFEPFFGVYNSWWILVIAAVVRFFPLSYFALAAHLRTVPEAEWEAAALGRTAWRRWARVRLALVAPGLQAAAVAVAVFASQELSATVLLAPPGHEPLIVRIYNLLHYDPEHDVLAALALFHVASVLALVGLFALCARLPWRSR